MLTLTQLDELVGEWVTGTYLRRRQPETGQPPAQRWAAGAWLPRMPESLEALDLLLLTVATPRKVQRDGVHLHGLRYFATTLAPCVGEAVTFRYLTARRGLAELLNEPRPAMRGGSREKLAAHRRRPRGCRD